MSLFNIETDGTSSLSIVLSGMGRIFFPEYVWSSFLMALTFAAKSLEYSGLRFFSELLNRAHGKSEAWGRTGFSSDRTGSGVFQNACGLARLQAFPMRNNGLIFCSTSPAPQGGVSPYPTI
jgi:hypothetical protein